MQHMKTEKSTMLRFHSTISSMSTWRRPRSKVRSTSRTLKELLISFLSSIWAVFRRRSESTSRITKGTFTVSRRRSGMRLGSFRRLLSRWGTSARLFIQKTCLKWNLSTTCTGPTKMPSNSLKWNLISIPISSVFFITFVRWLITCPFKMKSTSRTFPYLEPNKQPFKNPEK